MDSIRKMKKITTIMDLIGLCLAIILIVFAIILMVVATAFLGNITDYLENGVFSELVGGYQVLGGTIALGGSLLAIAVVGILLFLVLAVLVAFGVPSIHGIVFQKKTDTYLEMGLDIYQKKARKDSIIKLIFNGIPLVCFIYSMIDARSIFAIGIVLYYAVICGLEIAVLYKIRNL